MAKKLRISKAAVHDLEKIWGYVALDNETAADHLIDAIHEDCKKIARLNAIGRPRDELAKGLYSLAHGRYVLFFRREEHKVQIIRILHGARDIPWHFSG